MTYDFERFDPCRSEYWTDTRPFGVDALLRLETELELNFDDLLGCSAPKLRLVSEAAAGRERVFGSEGIRPGSRTGPALARRDPGRFGEEAHARAREASRRETARGRSRSSGLSERAVAETRVTRSPGAWLVYADAAYPGWRASLDGREVPIAEADLAFKAVWVPSGEHVVRFSFGSRLGRLASWALAAFGATYGLALLVGLGLCLAGAPVAREEGLERGCGRVGTSSDMRSSRGIGGLVGVTEQPLAVPIWLMLCAVAIGAASRAPLAGPERALEGALVLAGVVTYPPSSLMAHYYLGSWTLLHQVGALLLWLGIDQRAVELFFCIFPSGLQLGALTMLIYGFCRRPLFSLATGTICFLTGMIARSFASPDYPLMGVTWDGAAPHTFGLWSGAIAAWYFGALAGGRNVMAGVSAALLVAVHPVIGAYVVGLSLAVIAAGRLLSRDLPIAGIGRGLLWGGLATAVSLAFYLALRPPVTVPRRCRLRSQTYMTIWEYHRNVAMPPDFAAVVLQPVAFLSVALLAVLLLPRGRRSSTDVAALALLGTVVASSLLYLAVHLAPDFSRRSSNVRCPVACSICTRQVAGAVAVGIAAWITESVAISASKREAFRLLRMPTAAVYALLAVLLAIGVRADRPLRELAVRTKDFVGNRLPHLGDADPFWSAVRTSAVQGLVLTSYDARYPALVEGHLPVAFDLTGFDFVPYLPHTVKDVQRFVERGYGVSFSNPPKQLRFRGGLEGDPQRAYWAGLTAEQWSALGEELDVVGVVAPSEWAIMLQPQVTGTHFTLYLIPRVP